MRKSRLDYGIILGVVFVLVICTVPNISAGVISSKTLGDINNDGKIEIARMETISGSSTLYRTLKIESGGKAVLTIPVLQGDTADSYLIVNRKIVVWRGDWISVQSKWEPHYYDFCWYEWSASRKRYIQSKEGFTVKPYTFATAKTEMAKVALQPGKKVIICKGKSFKEDALKLASAKYHHRFTGARQNKLPGFPKTGRSYHIDSDQWVFVEFRRNGTIEIDTM